MLLDFHLTLLNFVIRCPDITMKLHFVTETENKFVLQKFYNNLELKERLSLKQEMIVFCGKKLQPSCNLKYVM